MTKRKPIGIGSFSLVVFMIAIVISFSTRSRAAIGDYILTSMGLHAWSNGTSGFHYTVIISVVLLVIAWFIGNRYQNNFGAVLGKKLSFWIGLLLTAMTLFNI